MKVERRVDTVIVEMDISAAEKLMQVLSLVIDQTDGFMLTDIGRLRMGLTEDAEVRFPSALYVAEAEQGYVILRDTTPEELTAIREERFNH